MLLQGPTLHASARKDTAKWFATVALYATFIKAQSQNSFSLRHGSVVKITPLPTSVCLNKTPSFFQEQKHVVS
jgi:hypothetical protein